MRLILAGALAGIAVFIWGALAHVLLPLGEAGIRSMPNEAPVLDAMRTNLTEKGLYFFPGMSMDGRATAEQEKDWMARMQDGPNGILVYDPAGHEALSARQLGTELVNDILGGILLGYLLGFTTLGLWGRVAFGAAVGLMGWLAVSVPYWNWYGFPTAFTLGEGVDQVVAWALAALVLSLVMRRRSRVASSPPS